jgi:hypothetical protein
VRRTGSTSRSSGTLYSYYAGLNHFIAAYLKKKKKKKFLRIRYEKGSTGCSSSVNVRTFSHSNPTNCSCTSPALPSFCFSAGEGMARWLPRARPASFALTAYLILTEIHAAYWGQPYTVLQGHQNRCLSQRGFTLRMPMSPACGQGMLTSSHVNLVTIVVGVQSMPVQQEHLGPYGWRAITRHVKFVQLATPAQKAAPVDSLVVEMHYIAPRERHRRCKSQQEIFPLVVTHILGTRPGCAHPAVGAWKEFSVCALEGIMGMPRV